tara:strand:- start:2951 stop:3661 length:711 start_codon:yes stop_codon:yes gene_type:complete
MPDKKRIIISGSSGVIGSQLDRLLSEHYWVIPMDLRGENPVDATSPEQLEEFFTGLKDHYGEVHGLVNCIGNADDASALSYHGIEDVPVEAFAAYVDINLVAVFAIMQKYIQYFSHCKGSVISISSLYSLVSPRLDLYGDKIKNPGYVASKFGLIGLTKYVAVLAAKYDINVNCIAPSAVIESFNDGGRFLDTFSKHVPMQRGVSVKEVEKVVYMLLENHNITGQNIVIDGGYSLW